MSATAVYWEAVSDDGAYVLRLVVNTLYMGEALRPDIFLMEHKGLNFKRYSSIFSAVQRRLIENSGAPRDYYIQYGTVDFDVSLLTLLAVHACGLGDHDPLLQKVRRIRDERNDLSHQVDFHQINEGNLDECLDGLLDDLVDIVDDLDGRVYGDFSNSKAEIRQRIAGRKGQQLTPPPVDSFDDDHSTSTPSCRDKPTWVKVTLGALAGITAVSVIGSMTHKYRNAEDGGRNDMINGTINDTRNNVTNDGNECVVM